MSGLALDPGHHVGWARSNGRTGTLDLTVFSDHGQAVAMFSDWLDEELTRERPVYLAVERALFSTRMRGVELTVALMMTAHAIAWAHDVPRCERMAVAVRKSLTGDARAKDAAMREAVMRRGYTSRVSHEIDAAALLLACEPRTTLVHDAVPAL